MDVQVLEIILGSSLLSALGAAGKYMLDNYRQDKKDKTPLSVATATSTAAKASIEIMTKVNDELHEEVGRLNLRLQQSEAHNAKLEGVIMELRNQVDELRAQVEVVAQTATKPPTPPVA